MSQTLYHATRFSSLPSIMKDGLKAVHHGKIHGIMEYKPPENAVYLSRHEDSNNLNTDLFNGCGEGDFVIVLEIEAGQLDVSLYFPDDAFFYMLDDEFNIESSDLSVSAFIKENWPSFAEQFGLPKEKALTLLKAFCESDGDMSTYAPIARKMAVEYLQSQGDIAYLGDVPAVSIKGWKIHPENTQSPVEDQQNAVRNKPRGIRP